MPLTKSGKRALRKFKEQYGEEEGKRYFYAYMNKYPERTKKWHKKRAAYNKKV